MANSKKSKNAASASGSENQKENAALAATQKAELEKAMEELNKISPGIGEAANLIATAYKTMGTAAAENAGNVGSFNTALSSTLRTAGPMTLVSLGIQAAIEWWDLYKKKVDATARAQEEAVKRMVAATANARNTVEALNKNLAPKEKNMAEQDDDELQGKLGDLQNKTDRQSRLNQANKEKELSDAKTPEQASQIEDKYELLAQKLEDWRKRQKAAIEAAMVKQVEKQIAETKQSRDSNIATQAQAFQDRKNAEVKITALEASKANAETIMAGPGGIPITVKDQNKIDAIDAQIAELNKKLKGAQTAYEQATKNEATFKSNGDHLGEMLGDLKDQQSEDDNQANFDSETTRQVFQTKGIKYDAPSANDEAPGTSLNQSQIQTVSDLNQMLGQGLANSNQILGLISAGINAQKTMAQAIAEVKQQLATTSTTGQR